MIAVQHRPVERPIWKADGLPADRLPFFDGKPTTNSLELPYEDLRMISAPNASWQIATRGNRNCV